MLEWIRFIISAGLILCGLFMIVSAIIGVYRFKYVLNRMHAAAMGDTLGLLLIVLGLIVASGFTFDSLKLLLLIVMFWLSSPVSSHLIGRLEVATNPELEKQMTVVTQDDPHKEVE
ncbi:MAG: monovalent cation/H(+) antiporter subunit G [Clostridia bacterium]|nr:monovalent cation/H(+) antiporter subunit G [Clostridia bacterium]